MKTLNIKLNTNYHSGLKVSVDNEKVKLSRGDEKTRVGKYKTNKDKVILRVYTNLDAASGPLYYIISFLLTLIGWFTLGFAFHSTETIAIDYKLEIDLSKVDDASVVLDMNTLEANTKAVEAKATVPIFEHVNKFYEDRDAKRRVRVMNLISLMLILAFVGLIVWMCVKQFGGQQ